MSLSPPAPLTADPACHEPSLDDRLKERALRSQASAASRLARSAPKRYGDNRRHDATLFSIPGFLVLLAAALVLCPGGLAQAPPPSNAEQSALIEQVRQKALEYSRGLPDFICTQETRRSTASHPKGGRPLEWKSYDTLTIELSYFGQKENYRVVAINGKPGNKSITKVGGNVSLGDFGSSLSNVLETKTNATFTWERHDKLRDSDVAVFSWAVDADHTPFGSWVTTFAKKRAAKWAARGELFVENGTLDVLRFTLESTAMPPDFPMKGVRTEVEYAREAVGDKPYLLPSRSESTTTFADGHAAKSETRFTNYRKFTADANIKFDAQPQN